MNIARTSWRWAPVIPVSQLAPEDDGLAAVVAPEVERVLLGELSDRQAFLPLGTCPRGFTPSHFYGRDGAGLAFAHADLQLHQGFQRNVTEARSMRRPERKTAE
jgi:hypothetical protein